MRKALLLSTGVGATLVLAVFVGAAAATTGAPVFYDARYPAPASTDPGGYDVSAGDAGEPGSPGAADEADAGGAPLPTPPGSAPAPTPPPSAEPTPPATTPPASEPETPTPTPIPTPTPTPTPDPEPTPIPDAEAPVEEPADRAAPGGPTPGAPAPDAPPNAEDQEAWLAFQQIVRECMAGAGQEYLYWEWWNPGPDDSNRFPAMPADLTADEVAAWEAALYGDPAGGEAYRWEDAGCWGYAVHVTGGTS